MKKAIKGDYLDVHFFQALDRNENELMQNPSRQVPALTALICQSIIGNICLFHKFHKFTNVYYTAQPVEGY